MIQILNENRIGAESAIQKAYKLEVDREGKTGHLKSTPLFLQSACKDCQANHNCKHYRIAQLIGFKITDCDIKDFLG